MQKKIGPAWCRAGRPADGHFTKRTAEAWLRDVLAEARAGTLPRMVRTGVTFARAADEWLRFREEDRACKPSTMRDYRNSRGTHSSSSTRDASRAGPISRFSPEEVMALVRAPESEQDAAIFLTAPFTGCGAAS